jgi:hypothetical protein
VSAVSDLSGPALREPVTLVLMRGTSGSKLRSIWVRLDRCWSTCKKASTLADSFLQGLA